MEKAIIVGSGPAGLTAGIYLARAGLRPLVIEGMESGGQLMTTNHVDNYPGLGLVTGPKLIAAIREQAERLGVRFAMDEVTAVSPASDRVSAKGMIADYECEKLLVATGAGVEKTNLPGEARYWGRGISACVTCDAAFYAGKRVAIVGAGPGTTGAKAYLEKAGAQVVGIVAPDEVGEFQGDGQKLTQVGDLAVDGAFIVTARVPQTGFLRGVVDLDDKGFVVTQNRVLTSSPRIFAAGDCAEPKFRQAIIAAGDGAYAALAMLAPSANR